MAADSTPLETHFAEWLKQKTVQNGIRAFEKKLCPTHALPARAGYSHSKECKAIAKICGESQADRDFLLQRLDAMRRYANADEFAFWPKWTRNEVRRAQGYLFKAAKLVGRYESTRKRLEQRIRQKLNQGTSGLPPLDGQSENLRNFAESAGSPLRSSRAYVFNAARKAILANILHQFPQAENRPLALLLSRALGRAFGPKNLREWRRNNHSEIATSGPVVSLL